MKRRQWLARLVLAATIAGLVALRACRQSDGTAPETLAEGRYRVARVVDGDTLLLANRARVRLIGVDCPESVRPGQPPQPWGREASAFARELVGQGPVRLTLDRVRQDRYGRFLAYVWVGERLLNEELVRAGLARFAPGFDYSTAMKRRLRAAEDEARLARRGIWSQDEPPR